MGNISVALPSDGETIDASDYNTPINTIVNEINGELDNSNIASDAAIDGSKLADGAVTPAKRTGGFKAGSFSFPGSTGNFSVTGVGFKPKLVEFMWLPVSPTASAHGIGHMDESGNQAATASFSDVAGFEVDGVTNRCIVTATAAGLNRQATYVSMDADGFTINVINTTGTASFAYKAYA